MIRAKAIEVSHAELELFCYGCYKLMKQKTAACQYAPRHWYGRLSVPVSKKQCKRAPRVPGEPPMLKLVYLLEKQNKVRHSLSIVRKCMHSSLLTYCYLPYIACLSKNARSIYCARHWRL